MRIESLAIAGALSLETPVHADERGWFRKPFQQSRFAQAGLEHGFKEGFFSSSNRNVLRGMHLQLQPSEQWKLVTCVAGSVCDVILDVRAGSATAGRYAMIDLQAESGISLLIPPGCAHGFLTTSDMAVVSYWVSAEYDQGADVGVRWDSAGISWPVTEPPTISPRDMAFPSLSDFGWVADRPAQLRRVG